MKGIKKVTKFVTEDGVEHVSRVAAARHISVKFYAAKLTNCVEEMAVYGKIDADSLLSELLIPDSDLRICLNDLIAAEQGKTVAS